MTNEVTLKRTVYREFYSEAMDHSYELRLSIPSGAAPSAGFPVYYVLDGNYYFQFARDVVVLQSRNALKTSVQQAIVVGIGQTGSDEGARSRRFYDFTPHAETYRYPERLKGKDLGPHGGAEKFLSFLQDELQPWIAAQYDIDLQKQMLYGHSLSGLFVLFAYLNKPQLFSHYVAVSPSIWWNDYALCGIGCEQPALQSGKRLFIGAGSEEGFMVEDAKEFHSLVLANGLEAELAIAEGENHASVVPATMSRAFRLFS